MTHPDHSGHHNADGEPVVARQRLAVHLVGQEDVAPGVDRSAGRTPHEMEVMDDEKGPQRTNLRGMDAPKGVPSAP